MPRLSWEKVAGLHITGTPSFLAVAPAPATWSLCSCVSRIAFTTSLSTPSWSMSDRIFLQLTPASIMIASPSHSMTVQLPSLPLASTWTSIIRLQAFFL